MKAIFIYIAIGALAVNVAVYNMQGTANRLQEVQDARSAQLCQVSAQY